jgi:glycosyltransferase involved in cell wall biosynthesis
VKLSVCIITLNEEANIGRTLKSVQPLVADGQGEIIVVDSGSTDRTVEIAKSYGAKVFTEPWKGFAAQKNSALEKAQGEWILSLDADEEVDRRLLDSLPPTIKFGAAFPSKTTLKLVSTMSGLGVEMKPNCQGYWIARKNHFLGRWVRRGGFFPDRKMRLFRHGSGRFEDRKVHEDVRVTGLTSDLPEKWGALDHHAYPTLSGYIEHMNKYSSLGAEMEIEEGRRGFSLINIVLRPWLTFLYNYFLRLGFLDGKEGLLLHMYHAVYVSWKYAKVWELSRTQGFSKKSAAP